MSEIIGAMLIQHQCRCTELSEVIYVYIFFNQKQICGKFLDKILTNTEVTNFHFQSNVLLEFRNKHDSEKQLNMITFYKMPLNTNKGKFGDQKAISHKLQLV